MEFLIGLLVVVVLLILAIRLFIANQGDAEFLFQVDQASAFEVSKMNEDSVTLTCKVPFVNKGSQDGTIMDCYTRHLLPYEQYDGVEVYSRLELETAPRTDSYFEAIIIPNQTGQTIVITVTLKAKDGDIKQALAHMVDMPIDIVYQIVARSDWYINKTRLIMKANDIVRAAGVLAGAR